MVFGFGESRTGLTVGELRIVLDGLRQFSVAAGAKAAAADLATFADMLAPHADTGVTAFVADMKARLAAAGKPKKAARKTAGTKAKAVTNDAAIAQYIAALRGAGTNRPAFEAVFERLKADKSLKAADVGEIAHQYASSVTRYKSIKAAHDEISKAFVREARFENKLK